MHGNPLTAAKFSVMIALSLVGYACSSDNASSDGGTPDAGAGGTDSGQTATSEGGQGVTEGGQGDATDGGHDGSRDATADGGPGATSDGGHDGGTTDSGEGGLPVCHPAPNDMSACNSDPPCTETCGLNISALSTSPVQKTCTCSGATASGGRWSCPSTAGACVYPTDVDLSCLRLPTPVPLCTTDTVDGGSAEGGSVEGGTSDGGSSLIRTNSSPCMLPNSEVCGGVCGSATSTVISYQDTAGMGKAGYCVCIAGTWQCASVNDWPTF